MVKRGGGALEIGWLRRDKTLGCFVITFSYALPKQLWALLFNWLIGLLSWVYKQFKQ